MDTQPNSRIIGAFVIGFALVGGAYVLSNFNQPDLSYQAVNVEAPDQQAAPIRSAIAVTDEDENGIEDWREEFISTKPIVIGSGEDFEFEYPTTLTGQLGITFFQDVASARQTGKTSEQVIDSTVAILQEQTAKTIYDTPDAKVLSEWDEETIRVYANTMALVILENNATDLEYELFILSDALNRRDEARIEELKTLAELYRLTRDAILDVPVPNLFLKEHLDMVNAMHGMHHDILAMTLAFEDPAYALLRLQRYEQNIFGLATAMENFYATLEPYASLFSASDPAVFFSEFSPANRIRI